ncbi:MAG: class I SAM-dependent methyltransferase family protein [Candidatus Omnitrophica bacterium]|nr:class I SAM-dependent methyltransferase family protein [Candidatus Omnitrophota bacterium]
MAQNAFKHLSNNFEDFFYTRIIKPIFFTSRLGRKTMFGYADSGLNFDHIYRNEAKGYTRFGKLVDRVLLSLPACRATRHRKERVIDILRKEIDKNISKDRKTRIVDLASGPARYLVELITEDIEKSVEALCLDINPHSLSYGKKLPEDGRFFIKNQMF